MINSFQQTFNSYFENILIEISKIVNDDQNLKNKDIEYVTNHLSYSLREERIKLPFYYSCAPYSNIIEFSRYNSIDFETKLHIDSILMRCDFDKNTNLFTFNFFGFKLSKYLSKKDLIVNYDIKFENFINKYQKIQLTIKKPNLSFLASIFNSMDNEKIEVSNNYTSKYNKKNLTNILNNNLYKETIGFIENIKLFNDIDIHRTNDFLIKSQKFTPEEIFNYRLLYDIDIAFFNNFLEYTVDINDFFLEIFNNKKNKLKL